MAKRSSLSPLDLAWLKPNIEVWFQHTPSGTNEVFVKAKLVDFDYDTNKAVLSYNNEEMIAESSLVFPINPQDSDGFDDMVNMENLNEAELLYNVKLRYEKSKIFTYVGPTLLAINPYMQIKELFTDEILNYYQEQANQPHFVVKDHNPHIYAVAGAVFNALNENKKNQAIVISGESGAGKTEETKLAMKFITSMGKIFQFDQMKMLFSAKIERSPRYKSSVDFPDPHNLGIEDKILSCNPILEAFGNAKTVRNDNSSRFGKLVLLLFQKNSKKIKGAVTTSYLLEKSRLTSQAAGERNYHIFYFLLKGAQKDYLQTDLELEDIKKYDYLRKSNCYSVSTINDELCFKDVLNSFEAMRFSTPEILAIWQILAAILHLGNIDFSEKTLDNNNPCTILIEKEIERASKLLGIPLKEFSHCFLHKTRVVGKQEINSKLNRNDCLSLRDSFTKGLYERLFSWLVRRLNFAISTEEYRAKKFEEIMNDKDRLSIGLLDIFGFEVFKINSFEQFCINFANEKLQQLYISYVFKSEIDEFVKEGLKDFLFELNFKDNQTIIDLFERHPLGIYHLIDESSSVTSTDENLLQTIINKHKENVNFKLPRIPKDTFIIIHSAKDVEYNVQGFRIKNKDELSNNLSELIKSSTVPYIPDIFTLTISGQNFLEEEELVEADMPGRAKSQKTDKFLGAKFRLQMKDLMNELNSSQCHFVRCLKPNEEKKKEFWVANLVLTQIRYLGVMDSIKIRKESYPIRRIYSQFCEKYYELSQESLKNSFLKFKETQYDAREVAKNIIKKNMPNAGTEKVLFGTSKIFMRINAANQLDMTLLEKIKIKTIMACKIQRSFFNYIQMKKIRSFFRALRRIQNLIKVRVEHRKFRQTIKNTKQIQQAYKRRLFRKGITKFFDELSDTKKKVTIISAYFKMKSERKKYLLQKSHVNQINKLVKGFLARRKFKRIKWLKSLVWSLPFEKAWRVIRKRWETPAAIFIQKFARRYVVQRLFKRQINQIKQAGQNVREKKATIIIQKNARCFLAKLAVRNMHRAASKIQGFMKMKWLSSLFRNLRENVIIIQKLAKKWLLNRHIRKERWAGYDYSDIHVFQKAKNLEHDNVFGKKEIFYQFNNNNNNNINHQNIQKKHNRNPSNYNYESINNTQQNEKGKNIFKIEKEEDILDLLENEEEEQFSELIDQNNFGENYENDFLNESDLLEELVSYNKSGSFGKNEAKPQNSQKPLQSDKDYDIDSNRKIVLFPLIVDLDFLADTSDIYKPLWSQLYNSVKKDCLKHESSIQLIEVGETFTLCATDSGRVYSWGQNDFFQLGRNVNENEENEKNSVGMVKIEMGDTAHVQKIIAGDNHGFALDTQKNLYCWGDNYNGQLGLGKNKIINEVTQNKVLPLKKIVDIQSKGSINICCTDSGELLVWPFLRNNGKYFYKPLSLPLPNGISIMMISLGNNFAVLIGSNGLVYSFGKDNSQGQLGLSDTSPRSVPALLPYFTTLGEKISSVSCGFKHTICKSTLGKIFVWGSGDMGQLGQGTFDDELQPKMIRAELYSDQKHSANRVIQIKAGFRSSVILLENRKIWWWGSNSVIDRVNLPRVLEYTSFLDLGEKEKNTDFIPIRLLSTWSKTCSIIYITMADTSRVSTHLPVIQKCCNNLASKWDSQTVDPPYIESFSKHFTFKALKKLAINQRKMKKTQSKIETRNINKEEKEFLFEVFLNKSPNSTNYKSKSPLKSEDEKAREEKLKLIKSKAIILMKTPKEEWKEGDHELMRKICDPKILPLLKLI